MGDVVEAVLQKLFPWMLDPMGKALQGMMAGAFSSTAGSVSYAEWNVAITAANRIGWVMGFVNMLILRGGRGACGREGQPGGVGRSRSRWRCSHGR